MKKGQGLSLGYVVVGIIAVVVLIVIILIFTGGIQPLNEKAENITSQTCEDMDGKWREKCGEGETQIISSFKDFKVGMVCCKKVEEN